MDIFNKDITETIYKGLGIPTKLITVEADFVRNTYTSGETPKNPNDTLSRYMKVVNEQW